MISCSDSRVSPEIIAAANLGEFFVVRTAGGILDDAAVASIEYGVEHLDAKEVLFISHTKCGAVNAALEGFTK